ncbi:MAG: hypothetical protein WCE60_02885 [Methanobacterium sp.]
MNSPTVTAGGGETVKKNNAWSAGAVRNISVAPITAKTPANLGLRSHSETIPTRGINKPTVMKNPANAKVLSSGIRVSTPNGVKIKPKIKPNTNKPANMRSELVRDDFFDVLLFSFTKLPLITSFYSILKI